MPQSVIIKQPTPNQAKLGQITLVKIDTYTIPANNNKIYQFVGDNLFLYASTGLLGSLTFSFDDQAAQGILVGQIISSPTDFKTVQIVNTTNNPITYTVVIANGQIDFKGLVISTTLSTQQVQAVSGTMSALVVTGAVQKIFAALTAATQIYLQADPGNNGFVFIGFNNSVTASKYVIALAPGAIYVMSSYLGDLYAFSTAAQNLAVSYA